MREAWTDERLDDLSRRMDRGFDRVDVDLRALNARLDGGLNSVQSRIDALHGTIEALQRTMLQVGIGLIAALIGVMATVVALAVS